MAVYERTQRESAHVESRVEDKSQVPSALTWAALGCVTASKGELNHVYQVNNTDLLTSIFGEPSSEHISLICADKIIADDNTMFLIRVAHENSLKGSQAIISTEKSYDRSVFTRGVVTGEVIVRNNNSALQTLLITLENNNSLQIKNINSDLSFDIIDDPILMENVNVIVSYQDVYNIDEKGNKVYSNELCLVLSDVADDISSVVHNGTKLSKQQYSSNYFIGEGYNKKSVIVLSKYSNVLENMTCDVVFSINQIARRSYGTNKPDNIECPVVLSSLVYCILLFENVTHPEFKIVLPDSVTLLKGQSFVLPTVTTTDDFYIYTPNDFYVYVPDKWSIGDFGQKIRIKEDVVANIIWKAKQRDSITPFVVVDLDTNKVVKNVKSDFRSYYEQLNVVNKKNCVILYNCIRNVVSHGNIKHLNLYELVDVSNSEEVGVNSINYVFNLLETPLQNVVVNNSFSEIENAGIGLIETT